MKKKILAGAILAALLSTTALADTSALGSGDGGIHGVLENDYVRAGVNSVAGSFGSGGNTTPGLLYDSTGTGTFNTSYDYLTPGSPFDGFSVMVDGTNYSNNNGRSVQIEATPGGLTDGENTLTWSGSVASVFDLTNTYSLGATSQYIDITSQITMGVDATDVWFSRHIDPDARAADGDSSSTDNVLGYGVIPDSNVAFSEALSSRYALGIYSTDSNVDAGISSWSQNADAYTENTVDGDGSLTNTGDNTIGLSWHWSTVSSGDILTASYAYIFGPSAFDAADTAITGGAGGGADTSSWGTLTDVGSATDAASAPVEVTKTYDYDSATATDTESSYAISTSLAARWNEDTELYDTRDGTFSSGSFTVSRSSDVPFTASDSSTGSDTVTETFSRTISGTHTDVMTDYSIGTPVKTSQGFDSSTYVDTVTLETVDVDNTATVTLTLERTGEEVFAVATPYTYTYDRTTSTTTADDFASDSGYTDSSATVETTSVQTATYTHNTEERENRVGGIIVEATTDSNQDNVALDLQRNLARGTTFGDVGAEGFNHSYGIYSGTTRVGRVGGSKTTDTGYTLGAGIHFADSNLNGNTGNMDLSSTQFGATLSREAQGWNLSGTVQHTKTEAKITSTPVVTATTYGTDLDRTTITVPGIPTIGADASSSNTSVSFLAKGPGEQFRPIIGGTYGKEEIDSISYNVNGVNIFEESGKDDTYGYATVGGELSLGMATLTALHHTDGVNDISIGIEKATDKVTWNVKANRTMTELGDTNSVTAGIQWKF